MAQEMKTVVVASNTSKILLAQSDRDRDVVVAVSATGHAVGISPLASVNTGFILRDTTTRFTLSRGGQLWAFASGADVTYSVIATDIPDESGGGQSC